MTTATDVATLSTMNAFAKLLLLAVALLLTSSACSEPFDSTAWRFREGDFTADEEDILIESIDAWGGKFDTYSPQIIRKTETCDVNDERHVGARYIHASLVQVPRILFCKYPPEGWDSRHFRIMALHELGHHFRREFTGEFQHLPRGNVMAAWLTKDTPEQLTEADRAEKGTEQ